MKDFLAAIEKHPTIILDGPPGTTAYQAKQLLQQRYGTGEEISADLTTADAREISTEEAKQLRTTTSTLPAQWRIKALILSHGDRLHYNATQALLKLIEEPPPHAKTIITTNRPYALPATVLSRAITITVPNLTPKELEEILTREGTEEPAWRATTAIGDLDLAKELDPILTKEWDKILAIMAAGNKPTPGFPYEWAKKTESSNEATKTVMWQIALNRIVKRTPEHKAWRSLAQRCIKERETAAAGRATKIGTATALAYAYAVTKTMAK